MKQLDFSVTSPFISWETLLTFSFWFQIENRIMTFPFIEAERASAKNSRSLPRRSFCLLNEMKIHWRRGFPVWRLGGGRGDRRGVGGGVGGGGRRVEDDAGGGGGHQRRQFHVQRGFRAAAQRR